MNKIKKISIKILLAFFAVAALSSNCLNTFADNEFSVSPMNQKIILTPGETYKGSFKITNPVSNENDFEFVTRVIPFYVDENYDIKYENNGNYNQIVDWTKVNESTGLISPNSTKEITFDITVPSDAPAGGQYAAITVTSKEQELTGGTVAIQNKISIAHIIYAEIAGTTVRKGEVLDANVPGFLFSGNISGTSSIKNTGNVHSTATYKLRVFPLFSNEEIYTNEENPETKTILPERTLMNTTQWDKTPTVGIFNVVYTAEFEGVTTEVKKLVIVCPIWLLAIIIFVILLIIFWIVFRAKSRKKSRKD